MDALLHVPACRGVEESVAGLQEGLHRQPEGGWTGPGGSVRHWAWRSGRSVTASSVRGLFSAFRQLGKGSCGSQLLGIMYCCVEVGIL